MQSLALFFGSSLTTVPTKESLIGDTSPNGCVSIVMLVFGGFLLPNHCPNPTKEFSKFTPRAPEPRSVLWILQSDVVGVAPQQSQFIPLSLPRKARCIGNGRVLPPLMTGILISWGPINPYGLGLMSLSPMEMSWGLDPSTYVLGTWWYKFRLLSQEYPHFPFETLQGGHYKGRLL